MTQIGEIQAVLPKYNLWEDVESVARRRGLVCIADDDRHLMLDLDEPVDIDKFLHCEAVAQDCVQEYLQVGEYVKAIVAPLLDGREYWTKSQNGGSHVYLGLAVPLGQSARIALQAMMRSDPKREALNLARLMSRGTALITLFETHEEARGVLKFLGRSVEPLQLNPGDAGK